MFKKVQESGQYGFERIADAVRKDLKGTVERADALRAVVNAKGRKRFVGYNIETGRFEEVTLR
jgi:hypothetical protein